MLRGVSLKGGLVGVGVSYWRKYVAGGGLRGLRILRSFSGAHCFSCDGRIQMVNWATSLTPFLHESHCAPCHGDNGLNVSSELSQN